VVAQLALLAVFIALGVVTVRRFHERLVRTAWAEHGTLSIRAGRTRRLHRKAEKAAMNTRPDYEGSGDCFIHAQERLQIGFLR
jgi:hypothetical protein